MLFSFTKFINFEFMHQYMKYKRHFSIIDLKYKNITIFKNLLTINK